MRRSMVLTGTVLLAAALTLGACEQEREGMDDDDMAAGPQPTTAVAVIQGVAGSGLAGTVWFTEQADGVHIVADISGAPAGSHGFHLHQYGDCTAADFTSTGGHFNPTGVEHGGPDAAVHHAGDFGNIEVGADGKSHLELTSGMLTVHEGPNSVLGRAIILHAGTDDLTSQPTGAAGDRLGCGVVGRGSK